MNDDQNKFEQLNESAIYRLRWVTDAIEAARRYTETHPDEVHAPDPDTLDVGRG